MDKFALLAEIAEMYYKEGLNQQDIADRLDMSRSMVSRYLTSAQDLGVVEITIHHPDDRAREVETELKKAFGVDEIYVHGGKNDDENERLAKTYALAAKCLRALLKDDSILAVAWGRAVAGVYKALRPGKKLPGLKVVQPFGSALPNQDIDGTAIIGGLASLLGGKAYYLHAPLHVANEEVRANLLADPHIREVIDLAKRADIILTGIGDMDNVIAPGGWTHYLGKGDSARMRRSGSVGHILTRHFDISGNYLDMPIYRGIIGISHESFMNIPRRIGAACGSSKVLPIIGALRGGFLNMLVTDEPTAYAILDRL